MSTPGRLRLDLDQNFPTPLINAVRDYLPGDLDLRSLREIDSRLSDLDDRPLFIALHQLGWDGLVTNNYKMLDVPTEIAAIVKTKAIVIAVDGLGHDPLRAVGALLLRAPWTVGPDPAPHVQYFPPRLPPPPPSPKTPGATSNAPPNASTSSPPHYGHRSASPMPNWPSPSFRRDIVRFTNGLGPWLPGHSDLATLCDKSPPDWRRSNRRSRAHRRPRPERADRSVGAVRRFPVARRSEPGCGVASRSRLSAAVHVASMIDVQYVDDLIRVVDAVANAVLASPGAPLADERGT